MKIGYDLRPAQKKNSCRRGIGRYTLELIQALLQLEAPKSFLLYTLKGQANPLGESVCSRKVFHLSRPSRANWILDAWLLPRLIERDGLDLFHAMEITSIPKAAHTPVWATVHDLIPYVFWEETKDRIPRDFAWALEIAWERIKGVERIITDSEHSKQDICQRLGFAEDKVEVVYLGCDKEYRPIPKEECTAELQTQYGIAPPFLFYVGGSDFRKNLPVLIEAFAQVRRGGYPGSLVLGGETFSWDIPEIRELKALIGKKSLSQAVIFPGYVNDRQLNLLYSACDFFVFPSLYEGFGLPVLEAMKCGAPVLASRASSIPEVAGDCAFYFDPRSSEDMAAAFWRAQDNPLLTSELRFKALERSSRFTWNDTARELLNLYETKCHEGGRL